MLLPERRPVRWLAPAFLVAAAAAYVPVVLHISITRCGDHNDYAGEMIGLSALSSAFIAACTLSSLWSRPRSTAVHVVGFVIVVVLFFLVWLVEFIVLFALVESRCDT